MCLIVFAWQCRADFPLIFAGNRDEFFQRPTRSAQWWTDSPTVLAGRDDAGGGTWCGVSRSARLAALTNFRAPSERDPNAPTRGRLVSDFLGGSESVRAYLSGIAPQKPLFNGFNLILGEHLGSQKERALWVDSNRDDALPRRLLPGIYGVSNAHLDTPWPKVLRAKACMKEIVASAWLGPAALEDALFALLKDTRPARDADLPKTGVPLEAERNLSSAFISMPGYGTRASSVILVEGDTTLHFIERSFDAAHDASECRFQFAL